MSTPDVPGANPVNGDFLHAQCWAEHEDGSLIRIDDVNVEGSNVVYYIYDISDPNDTVAYRHAMPEVNFKDQFSKSGWTWHDKSSFPWGKVMKISPTPGRVEPASARGLLSAAARVARSLGLRASRVDEQRQQAPQTQRDRLQRMIDNLQAELDSMPHGLE